MKKLFISCPMMGRTYGAIRESMERIHKIAELLVGEPLEVVNTYIEGETNPIICLGESIKRMAEADYYICPNNLWSWRGCTIESEVANAYGIKRIEFTVAEMMPDAIKALNKVNEDECRLTCAG